MDARIVEFAGLLRQNGLRVAPAEVTDAVRAAALVGVEDRGTLEAALSATLVKRGQDHELFHRLFGLYFSGLDEVLAGLDRSLAERLAEEGLVDGESLERLLLELAQQAGGRSELADALLSGDQGALAKLLRAAALELDLSGLQTPLQAGFYARRLLARAGAGGAEAKLRSLELALAERGVPPADLERISRKLQERLDRLSEAARAYVDREVKARLGQKQRSLALADRSFHSLSREEIVKTEAAVRKIALRLKARLVRRQREKRRGALHVRRTIRKNLGWGGVPAKLVFRRRRPQRPDVVVLCDVSDSVRNASRLMLLFVHTLQGMFSRVRSFAFVSDVGEMTEHFRDVDAAEAVDLSVAAQVINVHANSNYGRALATFARDHLGAVSSRTTVIVIGDGRNNYNPANVWALKDVRRKAKRVVWICPEERRAWGLGDSEMPLYERAVDRVAVVRTLSELEQVADQLVPPPGRSRAR